jgi:hypothetical protein
MAQRVNEIGTAPSYIDITRTKAQSLEANGRGVKIIFTYVGRPGIPRSRRAWDAARKRMEDE